MNGVCPAIETEIEKPKPPDLAHLVLKSDWPVALCGFTTTVRFGTSAPAMDRCVDCLRIAAERGLGRPGWE